MLIVKEVNIKVIIMIPMKFNQFVCLRIIYDGCETITNTGKINVKRNCKARGKIECGYFIISVISTIIPINPSVLTVQKAVVKSSKEMDE